MHESPGTVTLLFTDIEGSSRLWEQEPERMRPALARHDAITRMAVEDRCREMDSDSFDPEAAARISAAIVKAIAEAKALA